MHVFTTDTAEGEKDRAVRSLKYDYFDVFDVVVETYWSDPLGRMFESYESWDLLDFGQVHDQNYCLISKIRRPNVMLI